MNHAHPASFSSFFDAHNKRIVPVITLSNPANALVLADTLSECGFTVLELTLRTPGALEAIKLLRQHRPQLYVGAGTVKTPHQLQACLDAQAQFIVSPGINVDIIAKCQAHQVPIIPGVMTPSDIMQAENCGLNVVKLFPAEHAGGTDFIKAISPVFPNMRFFPTGGISEDNVNRYLHMEQVLCVGGSWLTPVSLQDAEDWTHIHTIAQRC